jgi:hypothetical protein
LVYACTGLQYLNAENYDHLQLANPLTAPVRLKYSCLRRFAGRGRAGAATEMCRERCFKEWCVSKSQNMFCSNARPGHARAYRTLLAEPRPS